MLNSRSSESARRCRPSSSVKPVGEPTMCSSSSMPGGPRSRVAIVTETVEPVALSVIPAKRSPWRSFCVGAGVALMGLACVAARNARRRSFSLRALHIASTLSSFREMSVIDQHANGVTRGVRQYQPGQDVAGHAPKGRDSGAKRHLEIDRSEDDENDDGWYGDHAPILARGEVPVQDRRDGLPTVTSPARRCPCARG